MPTSSPFLQLERCQIFPPKCINYVLDRRCPLEAWELFPVLIDDQVGEILSVLRFEMRCNYYYGRI